MSTSESSVQNEEKKSTQTQRIEVALEDLSSLMQSLVTSQELLAKGYDELSKYEKHIRRNQLQ